MFPDGIIPPHLEDHITVGYPTWMYDQLPEGIERGTKEKDSKRSPGNQ